MKKKTYIAVIFITLLAGCIILAHHVGAPENNDVGQADAEASAPGYRIRGKGMVGGLIVDEYQPIERDLDVNYFYQLEDPTYEQIVNDIGEPDGWCGSGIVRPFYEIDEGLYVVIMRPEHIISISLCSRDEVIEEIYHREDNRPD